MPRRIAVVDYHKGNLLSVVRSATEAGGDAEITDEPKKIASASGLIIPGVGSFEDAMIYLEESGEKDAVLDAVERGVPLLGICLGLQLLSERGDERVAEPADSGRWVAGLALIKGSATRLESSRLKVPHVGWDQLHLTEHGAACPLFEGVPEGANVYFTHSYALDEDTDPSVIAGKTFYARAFASAIWKGNIFGVQFHPEKSSRVGLRMLENYIRIVEEGGVR